MVQRPEEVGRGLTYANPRLQHQKTEKKKKKKRNKKRQTRLLLKYGDSLYCGDKEEAGRGKIPG